MTAATNDNLSRCASAIARFEQNAAVCYDDLHAFGAPSECYGDVGRGLLRDWEKLWPCHGFKDEEAFSEECKRRGIVLKPGWEFATEIVHNPFQ